MGTDERQVEVFDVMADDVPDYVTLLQVAKAIVNTSVLYPRFISGTPLENDIAVWMADFASDRLGAQAAIRLSIKPAAYVAMLKRAERAEAKRDELTAAISGGAVMPHRDVVALAEAHRTDSELVDRVERERDEARRAEQASRDAMDYWREKAAHADAAVANFNEVVRLVASALGDLADATREDGGRTPASLKDLHVWARANHLRLTAGLSEVGKP